MAPPDAPGRGLTQGKHFLQDPQVLRQEGVRLPLAVAQPVKFPQVLLRVETPLVDVCAREDGRSLHAAERDPCCSLLLPCSAFAFTSLRVLPLAAGPTRSAPQQGRPFLPAFAPGFTFSTVTRD